MSRIDEHLRTALRHAPDAKLQAPPELTARILAQARATTQAVPPRPRRLSPVLALLGQPRLLGLAALAGLGALWLHSREPGQGPEPAFQVAQMSPAPQTAVGERREMAPVAEPAVEAAKPMAPPARRRAAAAPAQVAAASTAEPVLMAAAPPPAQEFKPAPPPAQAPAAAEMVAVPRAAPPVVEAPVNPLRAWLATAEKPAPAWLLALAEASDGRWRDDTELATRPMPQALARQAPLRSTLEDAASAASAPAPLRLLPLALQNGERRASLLLKPEGLRWCEAGRCQTAPLSPEELQRLQALLPLLPDNPRP